MHSYIITRRAGLLEAYIDESSSVKPPTVGLEVVGVEVRGRVEVEAGVEVEVEMVKVEV